MTDEKMGDIMKGAVSSCSYEARRYGVSSAMSLSKAKSLCPDLILHPVDIPYLQRDIRTGNECGSRICRYPRTS